ncbi:MAG: host attachment protein [Gammaproteobacteria bacterium]
MNHYCVIVADCSRARFFCLDPAAVPELETGPNLVEVSDLVNPEANLPGRDTWTETKSGRNMARGGGSAHGYDDHRENHAEEFNRRFAKRIAEGALGLLRQYRPRCLVLAASSHMLGLLRGALTLPAGSKVEVRESGKDLAHMAPLEIHRHLAGAGLIPTRGRVSA